MSNLKKILALVLALVMSLSLVTVASAYKDDADVTETYEDAITVLSALGVFEGENGNFYPQRNITRAETAAILYRIVTGDVNDEQDHIYSEYAKFSDVPTSMWYAGYIGYCANDELIKGYGGNKFGPQDNVTGFQALAMILRAIGYGQNGEFEGTGWEVKVASTAKELGILDNIKESTLSRPATREMVAEMLFQGILVDQVVYSAIRDGYIVPTNANTIGFDTFGLVSDTKDVDNVWGQPSKQWYYNAEKYDSLNDSTKDELVAIPYDALYEYNTPETECDVASELGLKKTASATVYTNGNSAVKDTINPIATKAVMGAQGRQTFIYDEPTNAADYRVVYIDTLLANVVSVKDAKFDAAGHLKTPSTIVLDVYDADTASLTTASQVRLTNGEVNFKYSAGEMVLVNAVQDGTKVISNPTYNENFFILSAAESLVGAQSKIWWNEEKHTIDSKDYDDANRFHLDQAGIDQSVNHTWFFDQFGNLIGAVDITSSNYAVLKNIIWKVGNPGYAEATLIDLAGNETTVTVKAMDGINSAGTWTANNYATKYVDLASSVGFVGGKAQISDEGSHNSFYAGYAMYRVDTNMDGTVNLQGIEDSKTLIYFNANADIVNDASAIRNGTTKIIDVNDNTQFLMNNGDGTYTAYAGTSEMPTLLTGADIFYTDVNGDGTAEYVYVKNGSLAKLNGKHIVYVTDDAYTKLPASANYVMEDVILDGEPTSITVDSLAIAWILDAGEGKTFAVTFTQGVVTDVDLVTSINETGISGTYDNAIYLGKGAEVSGNNIESVYTGIDYRINNAVVLGALTADELTTSNLEDYGVWVVYKDDVYNTTGYVYVGEPLGTTATMKATVDNAALTFDASNKATYTGTAGDTVVLVGMPLNNATFTTDSSCSQTLTPAGEEFHKPFVVVSEDEHVNANYEVVLTSPVPNTAIGMLGNVTLNGENLKIATGYASLADAVANASVENMPASSAPYNLVVTTKANAGDTNLWGNVQTFSNLAAVDADSFGAVSAISGTTIELSGVNTGSYIVIKLGNTNATGGMDVAYYAYRLQ